MSGAYARFLRLDADLLLRCARWIWGGMRTPSEHKTWLNRFCKADSAQNLRFIQQPEDPKLVKIQIAGEDEA